MDRFHATIVLSDLAVTVDVRHADQKSKELAYSMRSVKPVVEAKKLVAAHCRLGHVSWTQAEKLCKSGCVVEIPPIDTLPEEELELAKKEVQECEACVRGKSVGMPVGHRGIDNGELPHLATRLQNREAETGETTTRISQLDLRDPSDIESDVDNSEQKGYEMESEKEPQYKADQAASSALPASSCNIDTDTDTVIGLAAMRAAWRLQPVH